LSASLSFWSSPAKAPAEKKLSAARTATGAWNRRVMRETPVATLYAELHASVALPVKRLAPPPGFCLLMAASIKAEADHLSSTVNQDIHPAVHIRVEDSPFICLRRLHIGPPLLPAVLPAHF